MDEILEKSLLYDFYGELLTEHQRNVYESFVFDDLSLAEKDLVKLVGRQYVGIGVVAPKALVKITKVEG